MFNTIEAALEVVEARRNQVYGIDHLKAALEALGNPQDRLKFIHIGGTNGKGSTTNFTRAILQEAGFRVGTFTSPHLISHNDRIRINDEPIIDAHLLFYINQTERIWEKFNLSMFEIDVLVSILHFIDEGVNFVIFEVGLGGRLDATNVITPRVSAITNVDYDHMAILGNTLGEIAVEKAGIIKEGVPILTTEKKQEVLDVFMDTATNLNAPFKCVEIPEYTGMFDFKVGDLEINLRNQGIYQIENCALAIAIVKSLDLFASNRAIKTAVESTHWAGRFEPLMEGVYVDGAHNRIGMKRMIETLERLPKPWTVVFSALADKDHHEMIEMLLEKVDTVIITEFEFNRAAKATELAEDFDVVIIEDFKEAIDKGIEMRGEGTTVITGSLYFISDARAYILSK